jgi:molybdate transport system substrate-binding protein
MRAKLILLVALLWTGMATAAELTVFAAASLTEAMKEIGGRYEKKSGHTLRFNFAGSNELARQIQEGAPADLFFSADEARMDQLAGSKRILDETRRSVLMNTLVIVVPADSSLTISDPGALADSSIRRIALANPQAVPAGVYSQEYLTKVGLWEKVRTKVVPTENVRACLAAVESGNVDLGVVYKTDAQISRPVKVAYEVPATEGPKISYPLAVVAETKHRESALDLLDFVSSPESMTVFERFGFTPIK